MIPHRHVLLLAMCVCCSLGIHGCDPRPSRTIQEQAQQRAVATRAPKRQNIHKITKKPEHKDAPEFKRPPWRHAAAKRLVAIGDVHGDLDAMLQSLRAAKLINKDRAWIGGTTVLVQTGDLLDRGENEQEIIDLLDRIRLEAKLQGGDVLEVIGNHELMNVQGDLRYVTKKGFEDFEDIQGLRKNTSKLRMFPSHTHARRAAFQPGGPYAKRLSAHNVIVQVGQNIFAHGGVLPEHVSYGVDKINDEMHAWMNGSGPLPQYVSSPRSPMWTRVYGTEVLDKHTCAIAAQVLKSLGATRMFVGHTVQPEGITSACGGIIWRIDVGMAKHYGGKPAAVVLDIGTEPKIVVAKTDESKPARE